MTADHVPALAVTLIVAAYWGCVGGMMIRVRRRAARRGEATRLLVPAQTLERVMWFLWLPLIAAWMWLPFAAAHRRIGAGTWLALPTLVTAPGLLYARFGATAVAAMCLLGSIRCWRHMGRHWRMAVDPNQRSPLLVDGPFATVRHPIYALSMAMMVSTVVATPTPTLALICVVHLVLMNLKARNEERFLRVRHGEAFDEYRRVTGRFLPRWGGGVSLERRPHG